MDHSKSHVVDEILQRKSNNLKSKWALSWATINGLISALLYMDINQGSVAVYFDEAYSYLIFYTEVFIAILFTFNTIFNICIYVWPIFGTSPLEVNPQQKKLFGVADSDVGFKSTTPRSSAEEAPKSPSSPSFILPSLHSSLSTPPPPYISTPLDMSAASWASSMSSSPNLSLSSSSWMYHHGSPINSINPYSPTSSFLSDNISGAELRRRMHTPSPKTASFSTSSPIETPEQLEKYLKDYEEKEHWNQIITSENQGSKLWNFQRMATNQALLLQKNQYQTACRSPQSVMTLKDDSPATHSGDGIWNKLKISDTQLDLWIENLRKWICRTILIPLVKEIDSVNETLRRLGSTDLQIGEVSQSTLRQIALTKGQHIPTLGALLPYLDIALNQEYLVQRLKDMSKGGCISEFKWNSGGAYKGKPWGDDHPTDCAIIMHVLCSYMDSRLPPDPHYPDGKTFTSQYFKKTPDKPTLKEDALFIYQSKIHPPHYRVIIGEDAWDLPKGRNNMFSSILLFLHHVKTKNCGMLGRVNLGPSGVNILSILLDT